MEKDYLHPTDDFCMIKSWSQAKKEFEAQGYFGKVFLGYILITSNKEQPKFHIGKIPPQQQKIILWVCVDQKIGPVTLLAFALDEDYSFYDEMKVLAPVPPGGIFVADEEVFCYEYEEVEIDGKKLHDWTIFSVDRIDNEKLAMSVAQTWDEKPINAVLHKCFILNDGIQNTEFRKCENYAVPIWKITYENGSYKLLAAFTDDYILFDLYDSCSLNWTPLSPGKGFVREGKYYSVGDAPDKGYYFQENSQMKIIMPAKEPPP